MVDYTAGKKWDGLKSPSLGKEFGGLSSFPFLE
jgi:hypothetical protein